ncbi:rho GTPase-activating protein 39-like isoform X1 [Montipora foliosa]|uniref:rho GTPase-activating protein 39-like isoform X1 n=1 Tax=Montipora foliosa TaxID=591990 RepID=UPI0035F134EA
MAEKPEWVEIIEPRTGEPMYANLKSGQCLWEPPTGVRVRKANDTQWWELYDQKTRRYYYYCAGTQTTVWHKPKDVEIIPLAKLQTLKAREKRRAAKAREEKREGLSRREGSERKRSDGSLRKDGSGKQDDSSLNRRESSGRKDGISRDGSSSRRHGSSRDKRERASSREHRKHDAEEASSSNALVAVLKEIAVVENGVESKTVKDDTENVVDATFEEITAIADAPEEEGGSLERQRSPEIPIPEVPPVDLSPPEVQDEKGYLTDEEGPLTPSGTLSRNGTLDDSAGDDHLSPSGTIERARQAIESASRTIIANSATSKLDSRKDDDSVFVANGNLNGLKKGHKNSIDDSLSLKLRAGGMPATTARLVEACAPSSLSASPQNVRSLRHKRQVSDSVLKDLRRDDDDDDDDDDALETRSIGTPSTLPRISRPSSIASPATGSSKHNTLERSHSIPGSKPPLMRALGAYEDYFSHHKKGVFRRKRISLASMLSWSKVPIKKPLILIQDRQLKKDAIDTFKVILGYMGDRAVKAKTPEKLALELTTKGWNTPVLRDEIYLQLCKQTTDNFRPESLRRGWELMAICLALFPPSTKFHTYLEGYINKHLEDADWKEIPVTQYARHCSWRLKRIGRTGAKRGLRKPSVDDIQQAKSSVFNPSMFGATLDDIMEEQAKRFPSLQLPWILPTLAEAVLHHQGASTEGIFRVPGDIDEVNSQKLKLDRWEIPTDISDPHVPASLLKLWFRELHEPLIPEQFYEECVNNCDDPTVAVALAMSLPEVNKLVLSYLIRFLQIFSLPNMCSVTKMDVNNLSMVWAPNCLRCPSDDPKEIFENTRKEMTFIRTLLRSLDASFMEGVR